MEQDSFHLKLDGWFQTNSEYAKELWLNLLFQAHIEDVVNVDSGGIVGA